MVIVLVLVLNLAILTVLMVLTVITLITLILIPLVCKGGWGLGDWDADGLEIDPAGVGRQGNQ